MNIFITFYRTIFFYFFIMLIYRILGKREVGELSIVDFVVSIFIAQLASICVEDPSKTILDEIVPIITLAILQIGIDYIFLKCKRIKYFFEGKPSMIIKNGLLNYKEMVKQRYSIDDLLLNLREQGIKSIEMVDYALLESNGKLSVFKKKKTDASYPLALIIDGDVQINTLESINKNLEWLKCMLNRHNLDIDDIFYCFYNKYKLFIITNNDIKK